MKEFIENPKLIWNYSKIDTQNNKSNFTAMMILKLRSGQSATLTFLVTIRLKASLTGELILEQFLVPSLGSFYPFSDTRT